MTPRTIRNLALGLWAAGPVLTATVLIAPHAQQWMRLLFKP